MNTEGSTYEQRVAAEIRAEMGKQKMTRADLSERTGLSTSTLRRYIFARERSIPLNALCDIAEALDLTCSELLARAESEPEAIRPIARRATPALDPSRHRG